MIYKGTVLSIIQYIIYSDRCSITISSVDTKEINVEVNMEERRKYVIIQKEGCIEIPESCSEEVGIKLAKEFPELIQWKESEYFIKHKIEEV